MRWALLTTLAGLAGCSFSARAAGDGGVPGEGGGGSDAPANQTCVGTFLPICSTTKPPALLRIDSAQMLDTDADPRCLAVPQQGGPDACALFFGDILINNVLQARGSRPLVLAATGTIVVGAGVVDVSSKRGSPAGAGANAAACSAGTPPIVSVTTAGGGGAGGSSGSSGGAGGLAATDGTGGIPGPPLPAPTVLAGGCPGQDGAGTAVGGAGGDGGGALYLVAGTSITVTNSVAASGAGGTGAGQMGGGGGAGAGGLIVFEAPMVHVGGRAVANGGGGGEGGDPNQSGASGGDGHVTDTGAAPGGATPNGGNAGGNGGAGASALNAAGGGVPDANGGGGGGGGVGFILMIGHAPDAGGMFSPIFTIR